MIRWLCAACEAACDLLLVLGAVGLLLSDWLRDHGAAGRWA